MAASERHCAVLLALLALGLVAAESLEWPTDPADFLRLDIPNSPLEKVAQRWARELDESLNEERGPTAPERRRAQAAEWDAELRDIMPPAPSGCADERAQNYGAAAPCTLPWALGKLGLSAGAVDGQAVDTIVLGRVGKTGHDMRTSVRIGFWV